MNKILRTSILLSFIFGLSTCITKRPIIIENQKVFEDNERARIERVLGAINEKYDIFVDVVITNHPNHFAFEEARSNNQLRFYISSDKNKASIAIDKKLQESLPNTLIVKLENQILDKYINRNEPIKAITRTANTIVSHLYKKGLLKKREPSQALAYSIFAGIILIFIILILLNTKSKNNLNYNDIWTDAYRHSD